MPWVRLASGRIVQFIFSFPLSILVWLRQRLLQHSNGQRAAAVRLQLLEGVA